MDLGAFNSVCAALPHGHKVVQWHGSHVWKLGPKVFAIGGAEGETDDAPCPFTIKTDPGSFEFLHQEPGVGREPHLPRGYWLRFQADCPIAEGDLAAYIARSHAIIFAALTKAQRAELED